jgi:hypothetical protein
MDDPFVRLKAESVLLQRDVRDVVGPHSSSYGEPTASALKNLFTCICGLLPSWTFCDVGSGFGLVVFYAHTQGAKSAFGVEVSPTRHAIASDILRDSGFKNTFFYCGDAGTTPIAADVVYSFDAVFSKTDLINIARAYKTRCKYFIHCTRQDAIFLRNGFVRVDKITLSMGATGRFTFSVLRAP